VRRALLLAGIVMAIAAVVATINGVVDPRDEFYSGAPLTAALDSNCLLADDVVRARSYPEFKRDLFSRRQRTAVVFDSAGVARRGLNMGFPGFGPESLLDAMHVLDRATPEAKRLTVYVVTNVSWFDPQVRLAESDESLASKVGYLFSPWTLGSSLDLMRHSRRLAFTGWEKERVGKACVVDRGSPSPAWRADGTLAAARARGGASAPRAFAWNRLSDLDTALAVARTRGWRVVGLSALTPRWEIYERELKALFAKHGYRWRIRRMLP
jgi:hypothetical protein